MAPNDGAIKVDTRIQKVIYGYIPYLAESLVKYEPLRRHLENVYDGDEVLMAFDEIEVVLGFALPRSAREHQAWWSNTRIGHTHAAAWLDAGWKTSALDLAGRRVRFVREAERGVAEGATPFRHRDEVLPVPLDLLTPASLQMIDREALRTGAPPQTAAAALLNALAVERRRTLLADLAQPLPAGATDAAALVREGRDGR